MKKRSILSLALVVAMVMTSFPVVAAEENVVPEQVIVQQGGTVQLKSVDSSDLAYVYESSDESVAVVSKDGGITAVSKGSCEITATAYYGETAVGVKKTPVTVTATTEGSGEEPGGGDENPDETTLPEGITTFVFDGSKITVIEGTDTNYSIVNMAGDEIEAAGTDTDGNAYYIAADSDVAAVEIAKKGGSYAFEGTASDSSISVKKDSTAKVSILAVAGTTNTLTDNAYNNDDIYTDNSNAENAVIKAKDGSDVTIGGTGKLIINGNGKNGIKAATNLTIEDVDLTVKSVNNAIASDTEMTIKSGTINVESGNDGIKSCNDEAPIGSITIEGGNITVDSVGDCIVATRTLTISGGTFDLTAYDGYDAVYNGDDASYPSAKGLKAAGSYIVTSDSGTETEVELVEENELSITGGNFKINTADDAIHSDGDTTITGGEFEISTGDDAIHANYYMTLGTENVQQAVPAFKVKSCYESIEAATINIYSGDYEMYCSDDIINAANADLRGWTFQLNIYGGTFYSSTSKGDGYDSNGNISLYGGTHVIMSDIGLGENNEPLDCDGSLTLSGATVLAIGRAGMGVSYSSASTNAYVKFGSSSGGGFRPGQGGTTTSSVSITPGSKVAVLDSSGNVLMETTTYWDAINNGKKASYVMYTSPELASGSSCTLSVDGTQAATGTASATAGIKSMSVEEESGLSINVTKAEKPEVEFKYVFVSEDPEIATVSETGIIIGVKKGNTVINATVFANDIEIFSGTYDVQVKKALPFIDVQAVDWYYDTVEYAYENAIMTGLTDTVFGPNDNLARAQLAVILYRMSGDEAVEYSDVFPDVEDDIWYTDGILWASSKGIVTGYTDTGLFRPSQNISREQIAVMLHRYAKGLNLDNGVRAEFDKFQDAANVSEYADEAMQWAVGNGIITGKYEGTIIDPQGNATRAECATMIPRFLKLAE